VVTDLSGHFRPIAIGFIFKHVAGTALTIISPIIVFSVGATALNHKIRDDAMKIGTGVISFAPEFYEVCHGLGS
jgi:hypothetical protein